MKDLKSELAAEQAEINPLTLEALQAEIDAEQALALKKVDPVWIIDSGATNHNAPEGQDFPGGARSCSRIVLTADDREIEQTQEGDMSKHMRNVPVIPNGDMGLAAPGKMADDCGVAPSSLKMAHGASQGMWSSPF